jgi:hypothetical protein
MNLMFRCFLWHVVLLLALSLHAGEPRTINLLAEKRFERWRFMQPKERSHWTRGTATLNQEDPSMLTVTTEGLELINAKSKGIDIYTTEDFGDCRLELEIMVPKGANSGVFLLREYEVQILDSHGRTELKQGDMGGIYGTAAPAVNASRPPGEWQQMVVEFRAPRFNQQGEKTSNAMFSLVTLNDQVLHKNLEVAKPTTGTSRKEVPKGPIRLQGDHGPVAFRNIRVTTTSD